MLEVVTITSSRPLSPSILSLANAFKDDDNADILVELGYQLSLSGEFDAAVEAYQAAARANEGDVRAMTGVVYCQV